MELDDMHPIAEKFFALNNEQRRQAHISLAGMALDSWNKHIAQGNVPLEYQETVAGTHQKVDTDLPRDALEAVVTKISSDIGKRYLEPICAMQDDDWRFGKDAELAYYAIYNTYLKYIEDKEIDDWLIVNQSLSSLGKGADIFSPLENAVLAAQKTYPEKSPNKLLEWIKKPRFLSR